MYGECNGKIYLLLSARDLGFKVKVILNRYKKLKDN